VRREQSKYVPGGERDKTKANLRLKSKLFQLRWLGTLKEKKATDGHVYPIPPLRLPPKCSTVLLGQTHTQVRPTFFHIFP
jgi:hypothetical protein